MTKSEVYLKLVIIQ